MVFLKILYITADKSHVTLCSCFLLLVVFALEMFEGIDHDLCFLFFRQINHTCHSVMNTVLLELHHKHYLHSFPFIVIASWVMYYCSLHLILCYFEKKKLMFLNYSFVVIRVSEQINKSIH